MEVEHRLSSNLIIRQNYSRSVRCVFYETGDTTWPYATYGGTLFVVSYLGRTFALTCGHNLHDFEWTQLVVTSRRFGEDIAGLKAVYQPSEPTEFAVGSDLLDVRIIEFDDTISASFFGRHLYVLDSQTISSSNVGDIVEVNGSLATNSQFEGLSLAPVFGKVRFHDTGRQSSDVVMRNGVTQVHDRRFISFSGLSGSPVFNITQAKLAGMMMRGGVEDESISNMWYLDITDIMRIFESITGGSLRAQYSRP